MANTRIFTAERAHERRPAGPGLLRRRALGLVAIGLAFVFLAGVNLDEFDATVGCIAAAAGGVWFWFLCKGGGAAGTSTPSDVAVRPATRRDPHFQ